MGRKVPFRCSVRLPCRLAPTRAPPFSLTLKQLLLTLLDGHCSSTT
jgi:hypothetical protein